eukprot:PhF_6_TR40729/c0_g1_i1/m.61272
MCYQAVSDRAGCGSHKTAQDAHTSYLCIVKVVNLQQLFITIRSPTMMNSLPMSNLPLKEYSSILIITLLRIGRLMLVGTKSIVMIDCGWVFILSQRKAVP